MKQKTVVLLSGGIDSTVALAMECENLSSTARRSITALSVDYGQTHALEIGAARHIAAAFEVDHRVIECNLQKLTPSPLTHSGDIATRTLEEIRRDHISPVFVPGRNTIFLSLAFGLAESLTAHRILLGCTAEDTGAFPDCTSKFIQAFNKVTDAASRFGMAAAHVVTPLILKRKNEVVKIGNELHVPFKMTVSCYQPSQHRQSAGLEHCGRCDACVIRADAFHNAGVDDPTTYLWKDF